MKINYLIKIRPIKFKFFIIRLYFKIKRSSSKEVNHSGLEESALYLLFRLTKDIRGHEWHIKIAIECTELIVIIHLCWSRNQYKFDSRLNFKDVKFVVRCAEVAECLWLQSWENLRQVMSVNLYYDCLLIERNFLVPIIGRR